MVRFDAKSWSSTMSCSPPWPEARTAGTPVAGGDSLPSRVTTRRRPGRSVTSIRPSGRNASPHGWTSPRATVSTSSGPALEGKVCAYAGSATNAASAASHSDFIGASSRVGGRAANASISEKMRGARRHRHGGQQHDGRNSERQRGDQRGQGAPVVRRALLARRHREAEFGRSSEHGRSFSIQPSTVPFPEVPYDGQLRRSCWKIKANP